MYYILLGFLAISTGLFWLIIIASIYQTYNRSPVDKVRTHEDVLTVLKQDKP